MKKVVIASGCRTAIGKMNGGLASTPASELGAIVIKEALSRAGVKPEQVDQVYMMRDAKITEIYEGTSEVQRMVIAGNIGVK